MCFILSLKTLRKCLKYFVFYIQNTKCTFNNQKYLSDPNERADLIKFFKDYSKQLEINIKLKNEKAFGKYKVQNQNLSDIQSGIK